MKVELGTRYACHTRLMYAKYVCQKKREEWDAIKFCGKVVIVEAKLFG